GLKAGLMIIFSRKSSYRDNGQSDKRGKNSLELAKEYYDFPMYRAPETFLSTISQGLPVLMLTAFFGSAAAGFYTIGRTVLYMPSRLIGKSVEDVFYPRVSEAAKNKENVTK